MEKGILTSVISGKQENYKKCKELIDLYSKNTYYVSENVGVSSKIKLANNTLLAANLISTAEILNILEKDNVDIKKTLEFINNSSGRNWATMQRYPDNILTGKYDYGFSYNLHKKDILTFMDNVNISDKYILNVIKNIYNDEKNNLGENMDHTEIVKLIK
jgi:3-hydroxyisobutyrate dehydrogenase